MQQHPVPQNVTSYQFRLIGDMTIKQFFLLSGGVGLAVFFYFTNLFSPIKWFFILTSALSGAALAFLPVEERPLDEWLIIYLRAIYRPTKYLWHKSPTLPSFFTYTQKNKSLSPQDAQAVHELAVQRKKQGVQSFLQTLPEQQAVNQMEATEETHLNHITELFTAIPTTNSEPPRGSLGAAPPLQSRNTTSPANNATPEKTTQKKPQVLPTHKVPTNQPVSVLKQSQKTQTLYEAKNEAAVSPSPSKPTPQPASTQAPVHQAAATTQKALTDASLPFPKKPTEPNVVVGMVLDPSNKLISDAIIEIRDQAGSPVRATKTNQLGQFFSTTPLSNGIYEIEAEKPGFSFDILKLELTGQIIEPIKIQAK